MVNFEVVDIQNTTRNGEKSLKAFVSVSIGGVVIHGFRIIQEPNRKAWVSLPVTSWRDRTDGKTRYREMLSFPSELDKQSVEVEILSRWEKEGRCNRPSTQP